DLFKLRPGELRQAAHALFGIARIPAAPIAPPPVPQKLSGRSRYSRTCQTASMPVPRLPKATPLRRSSIREASEKYASDSAFNDIKRLGSATGRPATALASL